MPSFDAQLGRSDGPGRGLPGARHFAAGHNPYVTGAALPADSPVFFGREAQLHAIRARLLSPDKPQSVSLLGERRIGKSSLLNQLALSLAREPGLLLLQSSTQNWDHLDPPTFFRELHLGICRGLGLSRPERPHEVFAPLRDLIDGLALDYRFVLVLDEFDRLASKPALDADFFANLRTLGYEQRYRMGFVTASRSPLESLCRQQGIEESSFWNIFGITQVLGLLTDREALDLIRLPALAALGREPDPVPVLELAGNHSALVQMAMVEVITSAAGDRGPDWAALRSGLRPYYCGLWGHCTADEQRCLIRAAAGKAAPEDATGLDLRQRGLLGPDGAPFAEGFAGFLREQDGPHQPQVTPQEPVMPPEASNPTGFQSPWRVLQAATEKVPVVRWALGVAGVAAAGAIGYQFLGNPRTAFLTLLGMFFFMVLLLILSGISRVIPKPIQLTLLWFLMALFMATCALLFSSVFFQWPLSLGQWVTGAP
jgi:serine/threonine-protein kinase